MRQLASTNPPTHAALRVRAPLPGTVIDLTEVPDPVFATAMLGPGLALLPTAATASCEVTAPLDGTVAALHPHAVVIQDADGRAVLVHLGIDTVRLDGRGFRLHVALGDRVTTGRRLITWIPQEVQATGLSLACPVIALAAPASNVRSLATIGNRVEQGSDLLEWS